MLDSEARSLSPANLGQAGTTLFEVLVVLGIMAIALSAAALFLSPAEAPLKTGALNLEGQFRQARAHAMATTSACRVRPTSATRIQTESAANCSAVTWTAEPGMVLDLPRDVTAADTTWNVCFNSRGQTAANVTLTVTHPDFGSADVEVLLGGMARAVE